MAKFEKGSSGNPGGRPKEVGHVRELARQRTTDAIETLTEIMNDKKAPPNARVHAANAILDRGFGKPSQQIETIRPERKDVGLDEVARMIVFSMRDAKERGALPDIDYLDGEALKIEAD